MRIIDCKRPKTIDEAHTMLQEFGKSATIITGGTAFLFYKDNAEKTAIDITALKLDGIDYTDDSFSIGATTRISELQNYSHPAWVLDKVAKRMATQQIRNMSTIGGSVSQVFPWSDFPTPLLALNAGITVESKTPKTYSASEFFENKPSEILKDNGIVTSINIPAIPKNGGFGYHKEVRVSGGLSTITSAAYIQIKDNKIEEVKVAASASLPFPIRLKALEEKLINQEAKSSTFDDIVPKLINEYRWMGKEGSTKEYATHLAMTVITDVLNEALLQAKGENNE